MLHEHKFHTTTTSRYPVRRQLGVTKQMPQPKYLVTHRHTPHFDYTHNLYISYLTRDNVQLRTCALWHLSLRECPSVGSLVFYGFLWFSMVNRRAEIGRFITYGAGFPGLIQLLNLPLFLGEKSDENQLWAGYNLFFSRFFDLVFPFAARMRSFWKMALIRFFSFSLSVIMKRICDLEKMNSNANLLHGMSEADCLFTDDGPWKSSVSVWHSTF